MSDFARAVYLAEHLFQMVPRGVWRDTGGDDGQGHYDGDYRAEQVADELRTLHALADSNGCNRLQARVAELEAAARDVLDYENQPSRAALSKLRCLLVTPDHNLSTGSDGTHK